MGHTDMPTDNAARVERADADSTTATTPGHANTYGGKSLGGIH